MTPPPPVLLVGSTGRLVAVTTVAVELGMPVLSTYRLLKKLKVPYRVLGGTAYVMLFQLERALWRWYGLSDDLRLFELAHWCYRDMERRGVSKQLQRLGLGKLKKMLKTRSVLWENLRQMAKTDQLIVRRIGRPRKPVSILVDKLKHEGHSVELGPSGAYDPVLRRSKLPDDPDDGPPPGL